MSGTSDSINNQHENTTLKKEESSDIVKIRQRRASLAGYQPMGGRLSDKAKDVNITRDQVSFRRAEPKDSNSISMIERICFPQDLPWERKQIEACIQKNFLVVAEVAVALGKQIVGYSCIDDAGTIVSIAVLPNCRGQQLGRALLKQMETVALENDLTSLSLHVRTNNVSAIKLYENEGFIRMGEERFYSGDNGMAYSYKKSLACSKTL